MGQARAASARLRDVSICLSSLSLRSWQRRARITLGGLAASLLFLILPFPAHAHPLGNFTVNRYSRLTLQADRVALTYVVDMAEIPAHQERAQMDLNGDGAIQAAEEEAYLAAKLPELQQQLHLTVNSRPLQWQVLAQELTFPPGQAGLPTLRLQAQLTAALPSGLAEGQAEYQDETYRQRIGWQEVVVQATAGVMLLDSTAPAEDISQELRTYPTDLLQSPLAVNQATFHFRTLVTTAITMGDARGLVPANASDTTTRPANAGRATDPFAELVRIPSLGPAAMLLASLAAFFWGAVHALSPGHGKAVVGAYLVGERGTIPHALLLGLTTTITHTAGVFALGFVTLFAAQFIAPEKLYPWLSVTSGLLVVLIGVSLIRGRLRELTGTHAQVHAHADQHGDHSHDSPHAHGHTHAHNHAHASSHSHLLLGADGSPVSWRSLLALGISGGLVPCPSALVVMLGAISLERIGFGLILILTFSLGLASVLTALGITLVYAGRLLQHIPEGGRWIRLLPVASALFITLLGVGITLQALTRLGALGPAIGSLLQSFTLLAGGS